MAFPRCFGSLFLLFGFLFTLEATAATDKPILVHYMPWYVAKPYSGNWGWHWTMNHFNPDTTNALGQRQIASWYYPLIGPYDSADPAVLEYHVLLMKLGGIDGVVADWYGQEDFLDYGLINQRTLALFNQARRTNLKFALCYEDRTVQAKIDRGYIPASAAISNAQQTMLYAQANYFDSSNYLRFGAHPVLLNFGPIYFKNNSQWESIFSVLSGKDQPSFFTEDNRLPIGQGAYNWPPMHLSTGGTLSIAALESYLADFQQSAQAWPAYISSAFPRFHDIYEEAGLGFTYGILEDADGLTCRSTLQRAVTNDSAMIQLVTWNDFGEGTSIEPTVEFGYRDLGIVQDFRRQFLDPDFAYTPNDLSLALRFYNLRKQQPTDAGFTAELDRIFDNLVSGNLTAARLQLSGLESGRPVIYDLALTNGAIRFSVGGYVPPNGADVQTTSNLADSWQSVSPLTAGTNSMTFTAPVSEVDPPAFFKVHTYEP